MTGPAYRIGDFRERVRVDRRATTPDGFGNQSATWSPALADIPAKIAPLKGGEDVQAARLTSTAVFNIVVRSDSATRTITTSDRLEDQRTGTVYKVQSILNLDERDRFLTLLCEEGIADG